MDSVMVEVILVKMSWLKPIQEGMLAFPITLLI